MGKYSKPWGCSNETRHRPKIDRMMALEDYKPSLAMVACQCIFAVMGLLAKAAFNQGFSNLVFVVYRQSIASLAVLPPLFFTRRYSLSLSLYRISIWTLFNYLLCIQRLIQINLEVLISSVGELHFFSEVKLINFWVYL